MRACGTSLETGLTHSMPRHLRLPLPKGDENRFSSAVRTSLSSQRAGNQRFGSGKIDSSMEALAVVMLTVVWQWERYRSAGLQIKAVQEKPQRKDADLLLVASPSHHIVTSLRWR